jgi:3'-5' exoribonuclease 1
VVVDHQSRAAETVISHQYILVVDLEATCDAQGFPKSERETIEIGAVLVDSKTLVIHSEFQRFVRPVRHPALTEYCTDLTGITQATVDSAPSFTIAFEGFLQEMVVNRDIIFGSWGGYDRRQLRRDCMFHGLQYPEFDSIDLSIEYTRHAGLVRRASMARALSSVDIPMQGHQHSGIDDARNLARLLPWCLGREPIPTELAAG